MGRFSAFTAPAGPTGWPRVDHLEFTLFLLCFDHLQIDQHVHPSSGGKSVIIISDVQREVQRWNILRISPQSDLLF